MVQVDIGNISLIHADCMDVMATLPDNAFDLAIIDPPYGLNESGKKRLSRSKLAKVTPHTIKDWDTKSPDKAYFDELFRVSKHQIIFGANHFISKIAKDSSC